MGTPCERMQRENARLLACAAAVLPWSVVAPPVFGWDEPQAVNPRAAARRLRMIVSRITEWYETGGNRDETLPVTAA